MNHIHIVGAQQSAIVHLLFQFSWLITQAIELWGKFDDSSINRGFINFDNQARGR